MLLRPDPTVATSEFLWASMNSTAIYRQATAEVGGSTSPHVNVKAIKRFRVARPPLELQRKYAVFYNRANAVRVRQLQAIESSEVLFSSLVQQSFADELRK